MKKFIKTLLIAPVFGAIPAFVVSCSKETVEQKEEKYINLNIDFAKKLHLYLDKKEIKKI